MSNRVPAQLDAELKRRLDDLREKDLNFRADSLSAQLTRLLDYYITNERQRAARLKDEEEAEAVRAKTMIHVGEDLKRKIMEEARSLGMRGEKAGVEFLWELYSQTEQIPKAMLAVIKRLS